MLFSLGFAFLAGIVTVLSPCILPVLPIILSSTAGKFRPLSIIFGFVLSFTFFTLFLSIIVRASGIPADYLRNISIILIGGFGVSLLIPKFQTSLELLFSKLTKFIPPVDSSGFIIGLSLGLIWTPCVGPILASVISLAVTGTVTMETILITLAYSVGASIPMLIIMLGGQRLIPRSQKIQFIFGILMMISAVAMYFKFDRLLQTTILDILPKSYNSFLFSI